MIRIAALWVTLLSGCVDAGSRAPEIYVVRSQDTLYSIAWRNNVDYRDLAKWNRIGPDFHITVGQRLILRPDATTTAAAVAGTTPATTAATTPAAPPALASKSAPAAPVTTKPAPPSAGSSSTKSPAAGGPVAGTPVASTPVVWVWPTDRGAAPRRRANGGIFLSGTLGQEVRAAAAGRVVYTGSGIRGYGQLIIIKHNDALLSAYAYNREVLVQEGQDVVAGQPIAHMGAEMRSAAKQTPVLYFEIRLNGRPIDPLPYLLRKK
jgi:lipoprotein NlpD